LLFPGKNGRAKVIQSLRHTGRKDKVTMAKMVRLTIITDTKWDEDEINLLLDIGEVVGFDGAVV
jgi:hypothetical protein